MQWFSLHHLTLFCPKLSSVHLHLSTSHPPHPELLYLLPLSSDPFFLIHHCLFQPLHFSLPPNLPLLSNYNYSHHYFSLTFLHLVFPSPSHISLSFTSLSISFSFLAPLQLKPPSDIPTTITITTTLPSSPSSLLIRYFGQTLQIKWYPVTLLQWGHNLNWFLIIRYEPVYIRYSVYSIRCVVYSLCVCAQHFLEGDCTSKSHLFIILMWCCFLSFFDMWVVSSLDKLCSAS